MTLKIYNNIKHITFSQESKNINVNKMGFHIYKTMIRLIYLKAPYKEHFDTHDVNK